ncbi:MAG: tRNA 2-selenouridine(34) synthase MnmH [Cyanobacteria bacterium J06638_28]
MVKTVAIEAFWRSSGPILDVRSPGEYEQGHLPGAISLPLFTNEERAQVGICYKQRGKEAAVELGFDRLGPKLGDMLRQAKAIAPERTVRVHCWRGGMRSGGVAWGLQMAGFQVTTLKGGYKAFRHWAQAIHATSRSIIVLGGMTGTGKTHILKALQEQGEQVLDLEGLANHRGSSFGSLDMPPQPSTEQFENLIADHLSQLDSTRPVWIEAESRRVGTCRIPDPLFKLMEAAPTIEITRPLEERLDILIDVYGQTNRAELIAAIERIRKRLGGLRTQQAIDFIHQDNAPAVCELVLEYYDRTYRYDLERRNKVIPKIDMTGLSSTAAAKLLVEKAPFLTTVNIPLET